MLDSPYPRVIPGPPRPSQIVSPVSLALQSGRERFEVQGGGAALIRVGVGDKITVTNAEGGQRCELVAAGTKGRIDAGILGVVANSDAAGLKALLSGAVGSGLGGLRLGMERRGIDLAKAGAVALFDGQSPAGAKESFTVTRDGVVIVAAPAAAMDPGAQDTAMRLICARSACMAGELPTSLYGDAEPMGATLPPAA